MKFETPAPKKEKPIEEKKPVVETTTPKQKEKPFEAKKAVVIEKQKPLPIHQISTNQKYTHDGFLVEILGSIEFIRVPAGKFLMGSNNGDSDEKPQQP